MNKIIQKHERLSNVSAIKLQYRSKRRGFQHYVRGQIRAIAKQLYGTAINIKLDKSEVVFDTIITSYILEFDNRPYQEYMEKITLRNDTSLPIRAAAIFDMFPFSILFNVRLL